MSSVLGEVASIAARHGVPAEAVSAFPQQGQVNLTICLGDDLILRIPRHEAAERSLAKEAAVIPVVRAGGIPTPDLVEYDASRELVGRPYMVLERVHGSTLPLPDTELEANDRAFASLGETLVKLHMLHPRSAGPIAGVSEPSSFVPERLLRELCDSGELGVAQANWLADWFDFLETIGAVRTDPVLLHGDIIPGNLIVDRHGRISALLDWGCADWGDPVRDFVDLPIRTLPTILSGYISALDAQHAGKDDVRLSLAAGAVWYQLFWALARLRKAPSTSEARNWATPRQARFVEILRFFSGPLPSPWSELANKGSGTGFP